MDETTKTQQGDTTSGGEGGTTSEEETPTFTQKQVEAIKKAADKRVSDALAEAGRASKAAQEAARIAQDSNRRFQERVEADLAREEEAARDDPDKLSAIQIRRQALKAKQEAEEERQRVEADKAEVQTQRQEVLTFNAERLADKYTVSSEVLLKYGGGTKASMEELAKSYGERQPGSSEEKTTRVTEPPDSGGKTGGGGKPLTAADVTKMSPAEKARRSKEIAAIPFPSS